MGNLFSDRGVVSMQYVTSTHAAYGVWASGGSLQMQHCAFTNNTTGLILDGAITNTQILSSTFANNTDGIMVNTTISPTLTGNSIYGNSGWGLNNGAGYTINAQYNWWGSSTGPQHALNPGGTGDRVSDRVDYTNWLPSQP
jgi:parallel beta-helix repeat protein